MTPTTMATMITATINGYDGTMATRMKSKAAIDGEGYDDAANAAPPYPHPIPLPPSGEGADWIPAYAGMTGALVAKESSNSLSLQGEG